MYSHSLSSLAVQGITIKPNRFFGKPFSVKQLLMHVMATLTGPSLYHSVPLLHRPKSVQWFDSACSGHSPDVTAHPRQNLLFSCQVHPPQLDFFTPPWHEHAQQNINGPDQKPL